jgi:hypothetical protein
MKKIVLSLLALAATMNIMAVTYSAKATITLESKSNYESCQMIIGQSDELAAGLNNGEYAEINMDGRSVALYVEYEGVKYQHFASNPATMKNLTLKAKTNAATNYNLIISDVTGNFTLKLGDAEPVAIAAGTTVISLNANQEYAIGIINYDPYVASVTTNAYGLATFSFDQPLAPVEAGVKLYKGAISGNDLNLTQVADYAANQGVVVYGEANTTYHFAAINGATADFSGNELLAASAWQYPHAGTAYVLSGSSLYIYEGENMKPNKAFLLLEANSGNAPRRISFRFNGTTAFENVEMNEAKAVKFMEDGKVFIKRGDAIYNLQGQLVK